eukprot:7295584-Pyramimonas_sp.AAC.1
MAGKRQQKWTPNLCGSAARHLKMCEDHRPAFLWGGVLLLFSAPSPLVPRNYACTPHPRETAAHV